jgi:hypothetical protein
VLWTASNANRYNISNNLQGVVIMSGIALFKRLEANLNEVIGSKYASVRREDLIELINHCHNLGTQVKIFKGESMYFETIMDMLRLREQGDIEELEQLIREQTVATNIKSIKDLDEYLL